MIDKIVKSVDELNAAAMHLRQSGDMDELRKLAKAWAVPYAQTEDYIQGKRYRLAEVPIGDKDFKTPFEKLREEMIILDDKYFAAVIAWYMFRKCEEEEAWGKLVLKKHKSLQRCLDFVTGKAFDLATEQAKQKGLERVAANTGFVLTQNEVFPWVEEYYRKEDEEEAKKAEAKEKQKIKKEWENREGSAKIVDGTKKASSKAKKASSKKASKNASTAEKSSPAETEEKKKDATFGQMSLFDLAG